MAAQEIVYPRTGHGPSEPKFLTDVTDRILSWFDKHVEREIVTAAGDQ